MNFRSLFERFTTSRAFPDNKNNVILRKSLFLTLLFPVEGNVGRQIKIETNCETDWKVNLIKSVYTPMERIEPFQVMLV